MFTLPPIIQSMSARASHSQICQFWGLMYVTTQGCGHGRGNRYDQPPIFFSILSNTSKIW